MALFWKQGIKREERKVSVPLAAPNNIWIAFANDGFESFITSKDLH